MRFGLPFSGSLSAANDEVVECGLSTHLLCFVFVFVFMSDRYQSASYTDDLLTDLVKYSRRYDCSCELVSICICIVLMTGTFEVDVKLESSKKESYSEYTQESTIRPGSTTNYRLRLSRGCGGVCSNEITLVIFLFLLTPPRLFSFIYDIFLLISLRILL